MSFKHLAGGLSCLLLLSACAGPQRIRKPSIQPMVSPEFREALLTRDILLDGFDEDAPVRLFGYILFSRSILPNKGQYDSLQQTIVKVFWKSLTPQNTTRQAVQNGIIYWPAHHANRKVLLQAALDQDWQTLLKYYHFERSALILNRLQLEVAQPLLVVAAEPLGQVVGEFKSTGKKVLILDLSQVMEAKLEDMFRKVQKEIMEKPGQLQRSWNQKILYSYFRLFFKKQNEKAVSIKILD